MESEMIQDILQKKSASVVYESRRHLVLWFDESVDLVASVSSVGYWLLLFSAVFVSFVSRDMNLIP
jgi:hypothetical protein